jgi:hypothetical protein
MSRIVVTAISEFGGKTLDRSPDSRCYRIAISDCVDVLWCLLTFDGRLSTIVYY